MELPFIRLNVVLASLRTSWKLWKWIHQQVPLCFELAPAGQAKPGSAGLQPCNNLGSPARIWVNCNDLTGIMVNKGNHPQMALIQVSEIFFLPRWMGVCWCLLTRNSGGYQCKNFWASHNLDMKIGDMNQQKWDFNQKLVHVQ